MLKKKRINGSVKELDGGAFKKTREKEPTEGGEGEEEVTHTRLLTERKKRNPEYREESRPLERGTGGKNDNAAPVVG